MFMTDLKKVLIVFFVVLLTIFITSNYLGYVHGYPEGNVAIIPLKGFLGTVSTPLEATTTSDKIIKLVDEAESNPNIEAIVFDINSGGGTSVSSKEIAERVKDINVTTIAWIREVGASGAYLTASACDYIFADELSFVGSIGATASYLDFTGLMSKYGVEEVRLVSGELKDMGSGTSNTTQEELLLMQSFVNDSFNYILNFVANNRNLTSKQKETISDGRIIMGNDSIELGLVDEFGTKKDIVKYLEEEKNTTVTFHEYGRTSILDLPNFLRNNNDYLSILMR